MISVGDTIRDYQIIARLRSGGMATLFLGRRKGAAGFSRFVAIKVVHSHLSSDSTFVRMFVDEALLSARINHPNVVHVEELGEISESYFLVMEYVHGCSLAQLMRTLFSDGRRMIPELAVAIAIKVAEGLHAAHDTTDEKGNPLGVVHRDVSPQNILLAYKGHVKLIDFGIAKASGRAHQTMTGSLKGKLRYMSPEQAYGRPVDRRADVYALGIVLWEMLTGRRLFVAETDLELLDHVRNPQIQPPNHWMPDLPPALCAAVMKALSTKIEDRPATANEFRRLLVQAMPGALLIDAPQIAGLLRSVMKDVLAKERETLPDSVSGVLAGALGPTQNEASEQEAEFDSSIIDRLTLSAAGLPGIDESQKDWTGRSLVKAISTGPRRTWWWISAAAVLAVLGGIIAARFWPELRKTNPQSPNTQSPTTKVQEPGSRPSAPAPVVPPPRATKAVTENEPVQDAGGVGETVTRVRSSKSPRRHRKSLPTKQPGQEGNVVDGVPIVDDPEF